MKQLQLLQEMRKHGGIATTHGLDDKAITAFCEKDPTLCNAIEEAARLHKQLRDHSPELLELPESELCARLQESFINFYAHDAINPYVALTAYGPWIVTSKGAVIHDNGGYGMLGMGHNPAEILNTMSKPAVMANIMTPSFSQYRLAGVLRQEIGQKRAEGCPYDRFICLNSGSEAVSMAARLADISARQRTDEGAADAGKTIRHLSLKSGFHGRTDRPARFSDSSRPAYKKYLASFRDDNSLLTVPPNDTEALKKIFEQANQEGFIIDAFFMEPVMGEGNPGMSVTPDFYALARELCSRHNTLLLVDSIQAGLRSHGYLSVCDYPGFENLPAPDMETYSKALNAGQYPLSVLAMSEKAADLYKAGVYGNTMTANPRALDIATRVIESLDDNTRANIRDRGLEFLEKFRQLQKETGQMITNVQGTGLLLSVELAPEFKAYGKGSLEEYMRIHGIGVIHGGENSLRFTPHFSITSAEVDLVVAATRDALLNGPRLGEVAA